VSRVVISRASFLQALEHYPAHQSAVKLIRSEYMAHEDFKNQIHRLCMRTVIWKRAMQNQDGKHDGHSHQPGAPSTTIGPSLFVNIAVPRLTESQRLKKSFRMWRKHAEQCKAYRAACEKRNEHTDLWVVKKKEAIARRRQRDEERAWEASSERDDHIRRCDASNEKPPSPLSSSRSIRCDMQDLRHCPPLLQNARPNDSMRSCPQAPQALGTTPRNPDTSEGCLLPLLPSTPVSPQFGLTDVGIRRPLVAKARPAKLKGMLEARFPALSSIYVNWRLSDSSKRGVHQE
jgi:hypothetical protein